MNQKYAVSPQPDVPSPYHSGVTAELREMPFGHRMLFPVPEGVTEGKFRSRIQSIVASLRRQTGWGLTVRKNREKAGGFFVYKNEP